MRHLVRDRTHSRTHELADYHTNTAPLTMAVLTMAVLIMAVLTMSILTMNILTWRYYTYYGSLLTTTHRPRWCSHTSYGGTYYAGTMGILTMAVLTMALPTMALLTMALLTMALLTTTGRGGAAARAVGPLRRGWRQRPVRLQQPQP